MNPTRKLPLFCITGASGAGKSTACGELFRNEKDYIVLESDIAWNNVYNTPQDGYRAYREMWMRLCAGISQSGLPCVLCGCCTPEQFEPLEQRALFTEIHYLAVVCDGGTLRSRLADGRGVTDEGWIQSSLSFNRWLIENGEKNSPRIALLNTSDLSPQQAAAGIDRWIRRNLP